MDSHDQLEDLINTFQVNFEKTSTYRQDLFNKRNKTLLRQLINKLVGLVPLIQQSLLDNTFLYDIQPLRNRFYLLNQEFQQQLPLMRKEIEETEQLIQISMDDEINHPKSPIYAEEPPPIQIQALEDQNYLEDDEILEISAEANKIASEMKEILSISRQTHQELQRSHNVLIKIDKNIDVSLVDMKKGNNQLKKAEQHQKSHWWSRGK